MSKTLKAFNKLVFLRPRCDTGTLTLGDVATEIQKDFLQSTIFFISKINFTDPQLPPLRSRSRIGYFLWLFNECIPYGKGFTPYLSTVEDEETIGYNCLGRAIALGVCLRNCKYRLEVYLGITPDHAMTIVKLRGKLYFCDIHQKKLRRLHGNITEHTGYGWYTCVPEDDVIFPNIVIQNFDAGIINSIMESFAFMQNPPSEPSKEDQERLIFTHRRFKLAMALQSVNWATVQHHYFSKLNAYKIEYRKEYLLGRAELENRRYRQDLKNSFIEATEIAYRKAMKTEYTAYEHRIFIEEYTPLFQQFSEKILAFLSGTIEKIDLPKKLGTYLHEIREHFQKNDELKTFGIERFKLRCQIERIL